MASALEEWKYTCWQKFLILTEEKILHLTELPAESN